jgi:hypothetical protein
VAQQVETRLRNFDVHGLQVAVGGSWTEAVEAICLDYAWFARERGVAEPQVRVTIEQGTPDFDGFDSARVVQVTEQYVVYRLGSKTIMDHLGVVGSIVDRSGTQLSVVGIDPHVARRVAFDFLLARVGDHLDWCWLPRIYGLGLVGASGAILVILPRGGGKTTLALRALQEHGIGFLSEVSPLVDRVGRLHAFPFPLWVRTNSPEAAHLPDEYVRRVAGEQTDPRLLELDAFRERIVGEPQPLRHIVIGQRALANESSLERLSRRDAVGPLFRESVARFSLADAVRFRMRSGRREVVEAIEDQSAAPGLPRPSPLQRVAIRSRCCSSALAGSSVWRLTLGRDREGNWRALARLLE